MGNRCEDASTFLPLFSPSPLKAVEEETLQKKQYNTHIIFQKRHLSRTPEKLLRLWNQPPCTSKVGPSSNRAAWVPVSGGVADSFLYVSLVVFSLSSAVFLTSLSTVLIAKGGLER